MCGSNEVVFPGANPVTGMMKDPLDEKDEFFDDFEDSLGDPEGLLFPGAVGGAGGIDSTRQSVVEAAQPRPWEIAPL
jgi:hypothetical protein